MFKSESRHSADDGGVEERMHHMPSGDHSATQLSRASEVYRDKCGYLLKRSGGKHSSISPRGMTKAFSFGQLTCVCPFGSARPVSLCVGADSALRSKHWDVRFFQIVGTDLVWGVEREDIALEKVCVCARVCACVRVRACVCVSRPLTTHFLIQN